MFNKNKKIAEIVKKKYDLIKQREEIDKQIDALARQESDWNFSEVGPLAIQMVSYLIESIRDGHRPLSVKEIEENVTFDDPKELHEKASHFAKDEAKRQTAARELQGFIRPDSSEASPSVPD